MEEEETTERTGGTYMSFEMLGMCINVVHDKLFGLAWLMESEQAFKSEKTTDNLNHLRPHSNMDPVHQTMIRFTLIDLYRQIKANEALNELILDLYGEDN